MRPSSTSSTMKRTYCGGIVVPPQKTPRMPASVDVDLLGERFEQLRRGEEAADFAVLQDRRRLIDDVLHVGLGLTSNCLFAMSFFTQRGSRSMK